MDNCDDFRDDRRATDEGVVLLSLHLLLHPRLHCRPPLLPLRLPRKRSSNSSQQMFFLFLTLQVSVFLPLRSEEGELERAENCDLFSGKWVYDEAAYPLYREEECPYIQPQLTCQEHGRPDHGYQHWRWQPHGCSLPRLKETRE